MSSKRFRVSKFREKVLTAWFDLGRNATSRMIADQIGAKSETAVSKAMSAMEDHDIGPLMKSAWVPYKSRQIVIRVHSPKVCKGQHCPVHNPSDHAMKEWPQNFRGDLGMTERLCPHGVGYPDPDDIHKNRVYGACGKCSRIPENVEISEPVVEKAVSPVIAATTPGNFLVALYWRGSMNVKSMRLKKSLDDVVSYLNGLRLDGDFYFTRTYQMFENEPPKLIKLESTMFKK